MGDALIHSLWRSTRALIIDSNYDASTQAACTYRKSYVYNYLRRRFSLKELTGQDAERSKVAPQASDPGVHFISGVGHGYPDCFTGHQEGKVFLIGHYDEAEVNGKTVHFFACDTAKQLGPDFVSKGCRAFFGYDDVLLYPMGESGESELEAIFACDSEIDRLVAERTPPAIVFEKVHSMFEQKFLELNEAGDDYPAACLKWAWYHLRLLLANPEPIPDSLPDPD